MSIHWIKNGRIIDPANQRDAVGDLFTVDGKIVDSLSESQKQEAKVFDADGLVVCPGFVDLHCHLREPGDRHKETIKSGSRAAAKGGFTTVVAMSNTKPPTDTVGAIRQVVDVIDRDAVINVLPTGCLTQNRDGKALAPIGSLKSAGAVAITDGGHCVQNHELMRRGVEYAAMFGLVVMDHCEDVTQTDGCVMNEGVWSLRLGLRGMPRAAEDIMVSRNVIFAAHYGAHIHLQHISSGYSVDIIRRAKERGIKITAEATPHHLSLTEASLKDYSTHFKVVPPLRTEKDRQALIEGLQDGTIDCIATAHAPHTEIEKDKEFDFAPFGMNGLETALSVCLDTLVHNELLTLPQLIACMTHKPAGILGLDRGTLSSGAPADITIFDPEENWVVSRDNLASLSHNSPWLGLTLRGKVRATYSEGELAYPFAD
ncbi:dihydroorotase [Cerasicoccus fimbriatus]|uniref:dihydroorotase n=1 Tax=Cerasicoccus fimbriatus TaxID=3014554 RepID=UPI0022B3C937|nr:dihydroorotase [Cerasicoccus sp. TK19100]